VSEKKNGLILSKNNPVQSLNPIRNARASQFKNKKILVFWDFYFLSG